MNTLETHVLELIGENTSAPDVFLDTDAGLEPIRESLNDAIEEITLLTGSYKEKYQLFLAADQAFYRIKLNRGAMAWITDAWLVGQKRRLTQTDLIVLNAGNPRWLSNSGSPEAYLLVGSNILGFCPVPSGGNDVVELTMVVAPKRLTTSTDRIRLRDIFKWAAVHYAVGEFYVSRGDAKEALSYHQKYLGDLGLMGIYPKSQERGYQTGNRNAVPTP